MLTLILLVVLGGGVSLVAVWLIDARGLSRLLGRFAPSSLRPARRRDTTALSADPAPTAEPTLVSAAAAPVTFEPLATTSEQLPAPRAVDRRGSTKIPAAYTAVEGTYREVARTPLWRKVVSLVLLLAVLAVIGVSIAALAGATFGIVAELVDGAVG